MAIQTLDERHKKLVEERLKGTPMTAIADELGVARQTLHEWWKDETVQAYYTLLKRDIEEARRERLTPVIDTAVGLLHDMLGFFRRKLEDEKEPQGLPGIEAVARVTEKLIDKQRLEGEKPTSISEQRGPAGPGDKPAKSAQSVLDDAFPKQPGAAPSQPGDEEPPDPERLN